MADPVLLLLDMQYKDREMSHYAKIENNIVTQVIVADEDFVSGLAGTWIQTSYNTHGGVHYGPNGLPDNGIALRKNYAGIGYTYDSELDAFIAPKPYDSWHLNTTTCLWEPPIPAPEGDYHWNEALQAWQQD